MTERARRLVVVVVAALLCLGLVMLLALVVLLLGLGPQRPGGLAEGPSDGPWTRGGVGPRPSDAQAPNEEGGVGAALDALMRKLDVQGKLMAEMFRPVSTVVCTTSTPITEPMVQVLDRSQRPLPVFAHGTELFMMLDPQAHAQTTGHLIVRGYAPAPIRWTIGTT